MSETLLIQLIFGWPAIITSLLLSIAALLLRRPWLLVIAGALSVPFSWVLSGYPLLSTPAILLPLFQFCAAWALLREKKVLAAVLLAPLTIIMAFLVVTVLTQ